jgi:hypothetical protein
MGRLIALVRIAVVTTILLALPGVSQAADLALNKPATASSTQAVGWEPFKANDGNSSTRWSSVFSVPQWWRVNLGSIHSINRVELNWEIAYASRYRIQTRTTTSGTWSMAATITNSSAGAKVHTFASRNAREVRIYADAKGTPWGVSLWDAKVCDNNTCSSAPLLPPPPSPQCSDGVDNADSEDTLVDMADPGCSGSSDNDETNVAPPGTPPAIAGQGYSRVFEDNFDTFDRTVWSGDIWWQNDDPANAKFVQNGVLNLVSRRSQGYRDIHTTTNGTRAWQQGYFECRQRWTGVNGSWPACWLMSQGWADGGGPPECNFPAAEIDIMEGQGSTPNTFYGTIHRNSGAHVGCMANENNWQNHAQPQSFRLADSWHTYASKWTDNEVCWYLDNVQTHCYPTYDTTNLGPMFMLLSTVEGEWNGTRAPAGVDEIRNEVDWVRVWQQ